MTKYIYLSIFHKQGEYNNLKQGTCHFYRFDYHWLSSTDAGFAVVLALIPRAREQPIQKCGTIFFKTIGER